MQHKGIPVKLAELYRKYGVHQPSNQELEDTLSSICEELSDSYIVFDALDECFDRQKTLNWINKLAGTAHKGLRNLHILITSRPLQDIEASFEKLDVNTINLVEAAVNQDIAKYINLQVESNFSKFEGSINKRIKSVLINGAGGSYVLVIIIIESEY